MAGKGITETAYRSRETPDEQAFGRLTLYSNMNKPGKEKVFGYEMEVKV